MVKRTLQTSISEDDGESQILDENRKQVSQASNKDGRKRKKIKGLYRQPTVNELNRLQETETLFNSNLFRLQIEEILQEVKVKEKTVKRFQQWYEEFKKHLDSIAEDETEYDLTEETLFKRLKVKSPMTDKFKKTKCIFKFYKSRDTDIVGSYALGSSINSKLVVDVQITVPSETYTKNDSINYRYHKKRAAYLAYLASHLSKLQIVEEIKYSWPNGCETNPVLDLKPNGKLGNNLFVRINLICEADAYKLHRFSPARNNLREAWMFSLDNDENNTKVGPPTPHYNSTILKDLTASANQDLLKEILCDSENLKQAIILLKIWLRQRKLQVSGHIVSLLLAYLVHIRRINNIMSSYQIVRNVWIFLKNSEWDTKGISLHKDKAPAPSLEEFHQHYNIVFLDVTGFYNICWQMSKGTYYALKRESSLAVEILDNTKINSFIPLFMSPVSPLMQFDHILRFTNIPRLLESVVKRAPREVVVNYGVDQFALVINTLHTLFSKGLGNRVNLILELVDADFSFSIKKSPEKAKKEGSEDKLAFGFILNPETFLNTIEKGPPANLPEAEEFRLFWGDKSELRRFQDGSITETCVWTGESLAERRTVTKQILDYLMKLKFGIPESDLFHICDQLECMTVCKRYAVDSEESSLRALQAFDSLRSDLRALTQLPLDIAAVYGTSPVFSYCEPLPAAVAAQESRPWRRAAACLIKDSTDSTGVARLPEYTPVCKAVLELGHSGKWPGNIEAFRCLKAAFHLQIAERLNKQYDLATQAYPTHLDVLKDGLVFRLEIAHPKEITLLRREIENGVVKYKESEESVNLQCETVLLPRLRGALHGLHQKHPAYGPTTCIFKRWLCSHLLSPPHFPSTVAELIAAAVFVHPAPLVAPSQPTIGFIRVLRLLAEADWNRDVIILDFNDDMTREEIAELERQLQSDLESEQSDSSVTSVPPVQSRVRIATALDGELPAVWSARAPNSRVLARVKALAASALAYVERAVMEQTVDNILGIFVPSLSGYDVLIHLHPSLVPYASERVDKKPEPKPLPDPVAYDVIPVVGFHPVMRYLDELRSAFEEFAMFFHDMYGGEVVAVLWKPDIGQLRHFQVSNAKALKPVTVDGETKYKVNVEALVEDFRILGRGLVRDITVNST